MRVATSSFADSFLNQTNLLEQKQQQLQNEVSTGLKLTLPEDNPAGMQQVLDLQAQSQSNTQYQSNITALQGQATASYDAMNSLKAISDRASEIATLVSGTSSPQDLQNYATEVNQLLQQAVQLTNTKYQGSYLFSGTNSTTQPFTTATDASGNITGVTYNGNTSVASSNISDSITVSAQTLGANTTGSGPAGLITDSRSGADFFNHLISLEKDLTSGNTSAVTSTDLPALTNDDNNIINHISSNSNTQAQLTAVSNLSSQQGLNLTSQISSTTSADLAQTLTQFSQTQTAYQAALQSGVQVLNLSILNFLY